MYMYVCLIVYFMLLTITNDQENNKINVAFASQTDKD